MENKTSKYFKYAIGEIILVVIGILIALQINNWNQERLNRSIEKETLVNLKKDLDSAMVQLSTKISQNTLYRYSDSIALELIHSKSKITNDSVSKLLLTHIYTPTFDPELGTLNEILNTGKMEVIKNEVLRNHISSWNRYMDELSEVDNRLIYLDDNIKTPLYIKHIPYRNSLKYLRNPNSLELLTTPISNSNFQIDLNNFFYSLEFENMLSNYLIYGTIQKSRLGDLEAKMMDMISIIETYLEKQ
jgi:hypothetical protein